MEIIGSIIYIIIGLSLGAIIAWLARKEKNALEKKLNETQNRVEEMVRELASEDARLEAANEKIRLLDEAEQKLSDTFKALSADALKSNNQSFLELAKASLETFQEGAKGELEKRKQAIDNMIKPINEVLGKVDTKIQNLEVSFAEQVKSLIENGRHLRTETNNLVKALRAPKTRGRWGEIQLKRVVEMAGMVDHCDFYEQESTRTDEGDLLLPDMLVRLPAGKNIIIDAKTPLDAYLEAIEATDEDKRKEKLVNHAKQVREHIKKLSLKNYWKQFDPSPEFVVLFLPGEVFFSAALEQDPSLIKAGAEQNVILATPTTLIALLWAVYYGWKEESLAKNAKEISDLGRELYDRLSKMGEHMGSLGKSLKSSVKSYNETVGSLESRVMVTARKFKELKAASDKEDILELEPVDQAVRELQAPEMTGDTDKKKK